jgi:glycosyltransferase involved in cell wall biosynthesis
VSRNKSVMVLGIRGIPAAHGGFETFAERLALYLVGRGWDVAVCCQEAGTGPIREERWRGVRRLVVPTSIGGSLGTIVFDLRCLLAALRQPSELWLVLGYGTGFLAFVPWLLGKRQVTNMDGLEWKRQKWSRVAKAYLLLNERVAGVFSHALVADHPEIESYLRRKFARARIRMIPYGADAVASAPAEPVATRELCVGPCTSVIARPEPENLILEIVQAFSARARRVKLVVLGKFDFEGNPYHAKVRHSAGEGVLFPGAVYDQQLVSELRARSTFYVHGHTVGGTNPSLVEALAAGRPIIAHDNVFNRWVAGDGALFFKTVQECDEAMTRLLEDPELCERLGRRGQERHRQMFTWQSVLSQYEASLAEFLRASIPLR